MSLTSRLALARLALHVRGDQVDLHALAPVVAAGVDLLVLGTTGDDGTDARHLAAFRSAHGTTPLLLAVDNGDAAAEAAADVVHVERPGWKMWGSYPKGHEWTLLGRGARDARTVRRPGDDWDYLFVGPLDVDQPGSRALREAVAEQTPFAEGSVPWFALGAHTVSSAQAVVAAGARRIGLTADVLDGADPVALVRQVRQMLDAAWKADPAAGRHIAGAFRP